MNIKKLTKIANEQGFKVITDRSGKQYFFEIRDMNQPLNPIIKTDRRGLEKLILSGIDEYLNYCETAEIEAF